MAAPVPHSEAGYFLSVLSKPPPLTAFDAFNKTNSTYKEKTARGGFFTLLVALVVGVLVWTEGRDYLYGEAGYEFSVDKGIAHNLQLNFDATVATPCHYLTVDVRDAVGDRLHISDEFKKDGTTFEIGQAQVLQNLINPREPSASEIISGSKGRKVFPRTAHVVENGPACRIWGSMDVKKVTGNLHITTLGHGYLSWEHTDHALMNLSHVVHEFSFGPYFPRIVQPLDNSVRADPADLFFRNAGADFHIFQYFLSVVSTTYVDARRRILHTNQYSVTDMSRETEHGRGVPGIFFKYDIEPMSLTFLVRLAGIIGGILGPCPPPVASISRAELTDLLVCSDFGFRTADFLLSSLTSRPGTPLPDFVASPRPQTTSTSTPAQGSVVGFGGGAGGGERGLFS
ncbi:SPOSA6832_04948, partial [Sporobolomyces salmonicolor]